MRTILTLSLFCAGCFDYSGLSVGNADLAKEAVDAATATDAGHRLIFDHVDMASEDFAGVDGSVPVVYPATCFDVASTADGPYTLYVGGNAAKPWGAYCTGMSTQTPKDYLVLSHIAVDENFSQYTAGGTSPGTNVRTRYTRIRIDPVTLMVDTSDQTFATSTGMLMQGGNDPVSSMPYAVAMDCQSGTSGLGDIDLRGTPFTVSASVFALGGYLPTGSADITNAGQTVALTGKVGCGWMAGGIYNSSNGGSPYNGAGGFRLQLNY